MRLGAALASVVRESPAVGTQEVLAEQLGIDQTTVSRLIRGAVTLSVERMLTIEDVCGVPHGTILYRAGLADAEAAIMADLRLNDREMERAGLLASYRAAVK